MDARHETGEPHPERVAGGSGPGRPLRAVGLVLFAAGLVIGLFMAGWTVAGAQTPSPSPSSSRGTTRPFHPGMGLGGCFGHGEFGFGAIHGEFTTPAPGGGYQTLAVQTGQVTSVSSTSIAVKSEDGFARTYAVDDNTLVDAGNNGIADVKAGDTVRVIATVSGGKATAVHVVDATNVQRLFGRWAPFPSEPGTSQPSSSA